ncbi:hypothetical protein CBS101457_003871 [Exobasidium rhododendri]|nr:hypothetical protein CBS101457_003871 [Exobasidium rhododendri]
MSRGRGRGGSGGGGSRGGGGYNGNGSQRGGREEYQWKGGRVLDEASSASRGGAEGSRGRGRGRGGPVRGVGLRASAQNAVGYNYGTPFRSGQQNPEEEHLQDDVAMVSEDEDDIILENHRNYKHVVKPHMEQDEPALRYTPPANSGLSTLLPPSVHDMHARAPSNMVALEKAQRAMQGQVAGLIPTGPKSAHVHRMYGTLDTVHHHNKNRQQQQQTTQQQFPLPVSSQSNEKRHKKKFDRPAENSTDDPCIAGVPRSTPRRGVPEKNRSFASKGMAKSNLQLPVRFEKASGDWRDGVWTRISDGVEIETSESVKEAAETSAHSVNPFDRASGAGLGFHQSQQHSQVAAPLEDDTWALEREQHDEEDDPIAALLKAHPGSREVEDSEGGQDDNMDYYQGMFAASKRGDRNEVAALAKEPKLSVEEEEEDSLVDTAGKSRKKEADESDDEDVILIPHSIVNEGATLMAESDSEEERQLDEIINQGREEIAENMIEVANADDAEQVHYFIDVTGEEGDDREEEEGIQYEANRVSIIGEDLKPEAPAAKIGEWESDGLDEINLTQRQPRGPGKKSRNAAKKARRRDRKKTTEGKEVPVAREGDSDLEWGSDGPPIQFRKKEDQDHFVQGGALQKLNLNGKSRPSDREEEEEMVAIALANSLTEHSKPTASSKDARLQNTKDAILADYMENAMGVDDGDEEEEDVVSERRDDRKVDKKTDLDALLQFMNGMDGQRKGREMTLEDIAIEGQMQEEDEWMTDSDANDSDEEEERIRGDEKKLLQEESSEEGEAEEEHSDSSDEDGDPPGKQASRRLEKKSPGHWSDTDDSDTDEDDEEEEAAFNRNFSWADADEDFIERLDNFAKAKEGILKGRDRGARNRLFKAIESGDFGMLDDVDMVIEDDDPVFGLGALQPAKGGKNAKKTWKEGDLWAEELNMQWEQDRARKAANKRKRAAERAAIAENPFHAAASFKKGTKKTAKKAARAERRAAKHASGTGGLVKRSMMDDDDDDDDEDDVMDSRGGALSHHATNLSELNVQIQFFLRDQGKTTLSLAPMEKRARAQVHLLAGCYNLISKSKGNGTTRFPTLIKNSRSGLNINMKKINGIVRGSQGSFGTGYKGKGGDQFKSTKDRASGGGALLPKNQEGASVGFGAERIGEENIGHKLLTMMGWSEGSGVGLTKGAADPVGAKIKVTKSGLGF